MAAIVSDALTTLARAKDFLDIGTDRYDTVLTMLVNQATGFIKQYCKRKFKRDTYTNEEYDGTGTPTLVTKEFPVTTFTQLQERDTDEPDVDSWTTIDDKEYYSYEDGRVVKRGGDWPNDVANNWLATPQRYRMTYVAGYLIDFANESSSSLHTLPMELEYVCQKLVAAVFNTRRGEGFEQTRIGDQSVTFKKAIFQDAETKALLDKYVKYTIA